MKNLEKEKIVELLKEIGPYYEGEDWLVIKKYLLRYLHPDIRKNFSTRESKTKKHIINEFESIIIDLYFEIFQIKLVLDESKRF